MRHSAIGSARFFSYFATAVLILLSLAAECRADVIYDNFGPGNSYDGSSPYVIAAGGSFGGFDYGYNTMAVPFTAPFTGTLESISLGTYYYANTDLMSVQVLADNGSGLPGTVLESFSGSFGIPFSTPVFGGPTYYTPTVFDSVVQPELQAGSTYWVAVGSETSDALGVWNPNNQGLTGSIASYGGNPFYGWEHTGDLTIPSMSVEESPVPEPSLAAIFGVTILALGRWRTKGPMCKHSS